MWTAPGSPTTRAILGAMLWLLMWSPATYAREKETAWADPQPTGALEAQVPVDVLPINVTDQFLIETVRELFAGSATFRQMVQVLKVSSHVIVLLRSSHELRQISSSLRGRGRLSVGRGRIVGLFEIADGDGKERLAAVAHEVAHAVEVALLPIVSELEDLHRLLLRQAGEPTSRSRDLLIETPFAKAVQQIVLEELASHDQREGRLVELAAHYDLSLVEDEPAVATP